MRILQVERREIDRIESLWHELKQHHQGRTTDYTQHYLDTTFRKRKSELLGKDQLAIFIAELDKNAVGFCVVSVNQKQGEVDSLFVQSNQRKCRAGSSLMAEAMRWLHEQHPQCISLSVGQGNEEVLPFYEKLGFKTRATVMELI